MEIKTWKLTLLYFIWATVSIAIFFQNAVRLDISRQYTLVEVIPYVLNLDISVGFFAQVSFLSLSLSEDAEKEE